MRLDRMVQSFKDRTRTFRPEIMRLEDRLVPGETLGASMPWLSGVWADVLRQDRTPALRTESTTAAPRVVIDSGAADAGNVRISPLPNADSAVSDQDHNTGAVRDDSNAAVPITGSDDLTDSFTSLAPMAPRSAGFAMMNEHAITSEGGSVVAVSSTGAAQAGSFTPTVHVDFSSMDSMGAAIASQASSGGGEASPLLFARSVAAPGSKLSAGGPATPYTPAQVRHAYGFDQLANQGAGQTIYIVDAYNNPNLVSDLHHFDATFGLPDPNFTIHKMSNVVINHQGWGVEESLDVQWSHAIAPLANITLVEATNNSFSALGAAVDWATHQGATIVSMSFGGLDGSGEAFRDFHFAHSGVSYVASSGDFGGVVLYPSASPYVLSIGGTNLPLDSSGNVIGPESAWSSGGGGASVGESEPAYQTNYGLSLSGRGTPDVAYNADPATGVFVYDTFIHPSGWYQVGGTSAGAPQWSALIALADESRGSPLSTSDLTNRTEYNAAASAVYASNYNDITTGSNGYAAGVGYDLATGLGSPIANNLVPWLTGNS